MADRTFTLFTLFDFRVRANPSWLLLAALILWSLSSGLFPYRYPELAPVTYWSMGTIGTVGLFFSLLFHEFSHSLIARLRGVKIGGITLFLFGGMAELTEEPPTPRIEFEIAIAGPLSSLLLAGLFALLGIGAAAIGVPAHWAGLLGYLGTINLILALFNLVPGYPLDGGRLLRAWLWHRRHDMLSATRTASRAGQAFGIFLMALGVMSLMSAINLGGFWWILIGFFVWSAASMSWKQMAVRSALRGTPLRHFTRTAPITVSADLGIERFMDHYAGYFHDTLYPVVENGRLAGCMVPQDVKSAALQEPAASSISDVMQPCTEQNSIELTSDAESALIRMQQHRVEQLLVLDKDRLAGIVTLRDLLHHASRQKDRISP